MRRSRTNDKTVHKLVALTLVLSGFGAVALARDAARPEPTYERSSAKPPATRKPPSPLACSRQWERLRTGPPPPCASASAGATPRPRSMPPPSASWRRRGVSRESPNEPDRHLKLLKRTHFR